MQDSTQVNRHDAVVGPPRGNVYQLPMSQQAVSQLDVPDVLKTLLGMTFKPPGTYRTGGRAYVVGDPEIDAEVSVSWTEDELTACALVVSPGQLRFRRRALAPAGGESPQEEALSFHTLSPDGGELELFADAAGL